MTQIKDFVLTLISASAATLLLNTLIPDGVLKKYLKYLFALFLLVVLLSPIKDILPGISDLSGSEAYNYDISKNTEFANKIVANHIRAAITEKFSVSEQDISVTLAGGKAMIKMKRMLGVFGEDITYYTATAFGLTAEVFFYE